MGKGVETAELFDELRRLADETIGAHFSLSWAKRDRVWRIWFAPLAHFDSPDINDCIRQAIRFIKKRRLSIGRGRRFTLYGPRN